MQETRQYFKQLSIHPYCTALGASGICTLLTRRLQTPHSLSVRPTALQTANGFIFPLLDPGTGYVTGVTHSPGHISIYVISLSLESLPGTQVSTVPFLPTQFCIDHSYSLSCIVVFMLSFWIVFSENYSLCRCIFFFICSWVQVRSMSSYSTILIYTPTYNIFKLSKSRNYLFLKVT